MLNLVTLYIPRFFPTIVVVVCYATPAPALYAHFASDFANTDFANNDVANGDGRSYFCTRTRYLIELFAFWVN